MNIVGAVIRPPACPHTHTTHRKLYMCVVLCCVQTTRWNIVFVFLDQHWMLYCYNIQMHRVWVCDKMCDLLTHTLAHAYFIYTKSIEKWFHFAGSWYSYTLRFLTKIFHIRSSSCSSIKFQKKNKKETFTEHTLQFFIYEFSRCCHYRVVN